MLGLDEVLEGSRDCSTMFETKFISDQTTRKWWNCCTNGIKAGRGQKRSAWSGAYLNLGLVECKNVVDSLNKCCYEND